MTDFLDFIAAVGGLTIVAVVVIGFSALVLRSDRVRGAVDVWLGVDE